MHLSPIRLSIREYRTFCHSFCFYFLFPLIISPEEGHNQQRIARWGSWPAMGEFKPVTFTSKGHDIIRLATAGVCTVIVSESNFIALPRSDMGAKYLGLLNFYRQLHLSVCDLIQIMERANTSNYYFKLLSLIRQRKFPCLSPNLVHASQRFPSPKVNVVTPVRRSLDGGQFKIQLVLRARL